MFNKVTICGMGVMGASLGHTLIRYKLAKEVCGLVRREEVIPDLIRLKLAHVATRCIEKAVKDAEIVILCTPVSLIPQLLKKILPFLSSRSLVMDVGSVKKPVVSACSRIVGKQAGFLGCHPMTGTEKFGFNNFVPGLYRGAPCILTPEKNTPDWALPRAEKFWKQLGAKVFIMTPEGHDTSVAWISHLPHVVSFVLMDSLLKQKNRLPDLLNIAAGSFKDMTRIAASSAELWTGIFQENRREILKTTAVFEKQFRVFRQLLSGKNPAAIQRFLSRVSEERRNFKHSSSS
ncbi:MAG: prephenate dehydrogenase [Candidatus Aureabacteria bacterium]|nr:prephenate dehydrogenase [Candidatus Auribacterota bacterium]